MLYLHQSGIRGLFHPEMGCAKASVRCTRCASGAQKLPRCATRCASGAQKLPRCAPRGTPGAQKIPRCATWGTPGAQKNPRGAKNDKVVQKFPSRTKKCPRAQKMPRGTKNSQEHHKEPKKRPRVTPRELQICKKFTGARQEHTHVDIYSMLHHLAV